MINYFTNCTNLEERRKRYRELAKEHHPDRGGNPKIMVEINSQYKGAKPSQAVNERRWEDVEPAKPCPFCGKLTLEIITSETQNICKVKCKHCGATGPETYHGQGRSKFVKWNSRL